MKRITNEYGQAVFNLPWLVAQDEGLFADEGIEVSFVRGLERDPGMAPETDPRAVDPFWRHRVFEQGEAQCFQACEWGQIRRSYDSSNGGRGGRLVMQRPAIASHAIFVRPDSPVEEPQDLRNRTIAVNFHAGSHYFSLQALEGFMPREEIKTVHLGEGKARFQAMMAGAVDACTLMEPYIALALKHGCKLIVEGFARGLEMSSPDVDSETLAGISRALTIAVGRIKADRRRYVQYLIADLPAELGLLDHEDFQLWRLRYIEPRPYPLEDFQRTRDWMVSWNLLPADASFESLVDNRIQVASGSRD